MKILLTSTISEVHFYNTETVSDLLTFGCHKHYFFLVKSFLFNYIKTLKGCYYYSKMNAFNS